MNLQTKYLEDENGVKYAPVTVPDAVRYSDGTTVNDKISMAFAFQKMLCIDFLQNADTTQFTNLYGPIEITDVAGINVDTLKISYGNVLEQSVTLGETDIDIANNDVVTLKITRTSDLLDAVVTLKFIRIL